MARTGQNPEGWMRSPVAERSSKVLRWGKCCEQKWGGVIDHTGKSRRHVK